MTKEVHLNNKHTFILLLLLSSLYDWDVSNRMLIEIFSLHLCCWIVVKGEAKIGYRRVVFFVVHFNDWLFVDSCTRMDVKKTRKKSYLETQKKNEKNKLTVLQYINTPENVHNIHVFVYEVKRLKEAIIIKFSRWQ